MKVLLIICAIILFFTILLNIPIIIYFYFDNKSESPNNIKVWVRYIFKFKVLPQKPKKQKPIKQKSPKKKKTQEKVAKKEKFSFEKLKEIISTAMAFVKAAKKGVKRLFKKLKITIFSVNVTFSKGDAAETAIEYGKLMAYINGTFAALSNFINIKLEKINIQPQFVDDEIFDIDLNLKARIKPITLILIGISVLFNFVKIKNQQENSENDKQDEKKLDENLSATK